jgi:putative copper export protein
VISAFQHITPSLLLGTPYGRLLLVKGVVAVGAFSLSFYNWRVVGPQLRETPRTGLLRIPTALELAVAVGVVAVTAALVVATTP